MGIKLLLFLPFLEIITFILFGDLFGFLNVIFFIIITRSIGLFILFPKNTYGSFSDFKIEPIDWICKRLSGFLLIIPGFITDFLGLLLLIKPFRLILFSFIPESLKKGNQKAYEKKMHKSKVIDAEYKDLDE